MAAAHARTLAKSFFAIAWIVLCAAAPAAQTSVDTSAIGPQVGEKVPPFSGTDQFGKTQTLETTLSAKGAMLVFFRSADW